MTRWAIVTGEYPPQAGGVSDYTFQVATALAAAGDDVTVYAPPCGDPDPGGRVAVRRLPDHFGIRGLLALDGMLRDGPRPDRVLVQYVPHGYGMKAMNVPFALWVGTRLRRITPLWLMVHEVAFPFSWVPLKYALLASVNRLMARMIVGRADRLFVTIPAWGSLLKRLCPRLRPVEWLPVPSNIPTQADDAEVATIRTRYATRGRFLVGHFGTFESSAAELLSASMIELARLVPDCAFLILGRGGERFRDRFAAAHAALGDRLMVTGQLPSEQVAAHLRACDLLLQPFPDGVTARRTTLMAGMANGVPVVTNLGRLSEPVWAERGLAGAPSPDPQMLARTAAALLADPSALAGRGARGRALYRELFALEHVVSKLRSERP